MSGSYPDINQMEEQSLWSEDELDEVEGIREKKENEEKKHQDENLSARKLLKDILITIPEPKTDNDLMLNYQYEYLINGDKKAEAELWRLAFKMARVILSKRHIKRPIESFEFEDRLSTAVIYLMRRYTTRVGYCVKKNFVKAISDAVLHADKYKRKRDRVEFTGFDESAPIFQSEDLNIKDFIENN